MADDHPGRDKQLEKALNGRDRQKYTPGFVLDETVSQIIDEIGKGKYKKIQLYDFFIP